MTQALDLLNTLSAADIAAMTAQPDPEGHIIVGGDRHITVPSNLKRLGVQFDHNMETVTFDCPRNWDGRDMSKMAVYVNYMRSDGYANKYPVDNVRADGEVMHFDWTISRNVTEVPGTVSFLVCVMKTDSEGNEERHWNSELCSECYISQGMETEEHPVLQYPDEVTQLLLRMATVEQINVQAEEMQTLYDNTVAVAATAEETKNQALDASGYIRNAYAPAIKGNVSGEVIQMDDVSPIEHDVKCWVHGKNLFKPEVRENASGEGYTNRWQCTVNVEADGKIVLTSTVANTSGVAYARVGSITLKKGRTYICTRYDGVNVGSVVAWRKDTTLTAWMLNQIITPTEDLTIDIAVYMNDISVIGNITSVYIQIEEGSVSTEYKPWFDATSVNVFGIGKNLVSYPYSDTTPVTRAGVTYKYYNDGLIVAQGQSEGSYFNVVTSASKKLYFKKGVTYHLSGVPKKTGLYYMYAKDAASVNFFDYGEGATFTPTVSGYGAVTIVVTEGSQASSVVFKPQIVIGSTPTTYELYKGGVFTSAVDGMIDLTSVSPNMTLFTDTPGVTIEAEYNRDTTKMFESYVLTDEAKSEIAGLVESDLAEVLASLNEYATSLIGGDS